MKTLAVTKVLTTKDVALGIGRRFTDDELKEYTQRTSGSKTKSAVKVKSDLKRRLAARYK